MSQNGKKQKKNLYDYMLSKRKMPAQDEGPPGLGAALDTAMSKAGASPDQIAKVTEVMTGAAGDPARVAVILGVMSERGLAQDILSAVKGVMDQVASGQIGGGEAQPAAPKPAVPGLADALQAAMSRAGAPPEQITKIQGVMAGAVGDQGKITMILGVMREKGVSEAVLNAVKTVMDQASSGQLPSTQPAATQASPSTSGLAAALQTAMSRAGATPEQITKIQGVMAGAVGDQGKVNMILGVMREKGVSEPILYAVRTVMEQAASGRLPSSRQGSAAGLAPPSQAAASPLAAALKVAMTRAGATPEQITKIQGAMEGAAGDPGKVAMILGIMRQKGVSEQILFAVETVMELAAAGRLSARQGSVAPPPPPPPPPPPTLAEALRTAMSNAGASPDQIVKIQGVMVGAAGDHARVSMILGLFAERGVSQPILDAVKKVMDEATSSQIADAIKGVMELSISSPTPSPSPQAVPSLADALQAAMSKAGANQEQITKIQGVMAGAVGDQGKITMILGVMREKGVSEPILEAVRGVMAQASSCAIPPTTPPAQTNGNSKTAPQKKKGLYDYMLSKRKLPPQEQGPPGLAAALEAAMSKVGAQPDQIAKVTEVMGGAAGDPARVAMILGVMGERGLAQDIIAAVKGVMDQIGGAAGGGAAGGGGGSGVAAALEAAMTKAGANPEQITKIQGALSGAVGDTGKVNMILGVMRERGVSEAILNAVEGVMTQAAASKG